MDGMNNGINGLGQGSVDLSKGQSTGMPEQNNGYGQAGMNGADMNGADMNGAGMNGMGQPQNGQYGQAGSYEQQTNPQYGQNGQGFDQYSQPQGAPMGYTGVGMGGMGVTSMNAPDYTLWLILGIIQTCLICCCNCLSFITGVVTIVLVIMANNSYKVGNGPDYVNKMKIAKIVCSVGWGLMIVGWVISLATDIFSTLINMIAL